MVAHSYSYGLDIFRHVIFLLRWFHLVPECFLGSALKIILHLNKIMQKYWPWYTMPDVNFLNLVQAPWACNSYRLYACKTGPTWMMSSSPVNLIHCCVYWKMIIASECLSVWTWKKLPYAVSFIKVSLWLFFQVLYFKSFLIKLKYSYIFFLCLTIPVFTLFFLSNLWPPYTNLLSIWLWFYMILDLGKTVAGFFPWESYCLCSVHPFLSVVSSRVCFYEIIHFHVSI